MEQKNELIKKPTTFYGINLSFLKRHGELIAALISGILILIGYVINHMSTQTPWYIFLFAYLIGGFAKAKEGIEETLKEKTLNVELLMIFAALGAAFIHHWFEGAMLIFIFALSGALETYSTEKSSKALSSLMKLQPETATRLDHGLVSTVPVNELNLGDLIQIKPSERVPADGVIVKGETTIDASSMTGESIPIFKKVNDEVMAGTVNLEGHLIVKVTKRSQDSMFSRILHLVQSAQNEKVPAQAFIEKFENLYVSFVLLFVALMLILPPFLFGWTWSHTIYRSMVLLVVASPCALVASTTPAILSAIANGARNGILIKGGIHLQQLASIQAIAFDKTGTLTTGLPKVTQFVNVSPITNDDLLGHVAAIESHTTHPLGLAIVDYAKEHIKTIPNPDQVKIVPGYGVYGQIDQCDYKIGKANPEFIDEVSLHLFLKEVHIKENQSLVFIERNGEVIGYIGLNDEVRETSKEAITSLRQYGIKSVMLTGDNEKVAKTIMEETGVDSMIADCLPDQKATAIKQIKKEYGSVAMIGDGINDTPALATADLGIGMGAGTDAALETADIILMKNDLMKIIDTVKLSKKMNRIIKQNIAFALMVILVLVVSNFIEVLNLPLGVVGHEGSTILVILNGLRLLKNS
ncbi:heavy metal translocating P-type ATPase [Terrilactibacillus laevilacticus]|uniref:Heavy metal translocating P-type ATPase n=1 Tax=Terrilactibacillus laevilacticus TaxID=1380157 RepID=A0ABW5PU44_9BACI|nr:heavy metal translocating P-type ATPase [Terrilactibacillus laevilacticus]